MKAAIISRYGSADVVTLEQRPKPVPTDHEVLIETLTTTVNSADWRIRTLSVPRGFGLLVRLVFGFGKPRQAIFGTELAGRIVAVGNKVRQFAPGDEVIAMTGANLGAHAEYVAIKATAPLVKKPATLSWEQAAALSFGGTAAWDFLHHKARLQAGERILINGASGTVGSAAVQLARHLGAHVTAVASPDSFATLQALGAESCIDYHQQDFTQLGQQWDVIMDTVGNAPFARVEPVLNPQGRLLMVVADLPQTLQSLWIRPASGKRAIAGTARESGDDLQQLAELAATAAFIPLIQQQLPFSEIRQAHQLLDQGHKRGSVVIRVRAG